MVEAATLEARPHRCATIAAAVFVGAGLMVSSVQAATPNPKPPGTELGGLDLAGFCAAHGSSLIIPDPVVGPGAASRWKCVSGPINMSVACREAYPAKDAIAFAPDPNDAFSWRCYGKPADEKHLKVAHATLDLDARAKRLLEKLRPQAVTLARRKETLEQRVVADKKRAESALAKERALEPKIDAFAADVTETERALARLRAAEGKVPAKAKGFLKGEASLLKSIAALEERVLDAKQNGAPTRDLEGEISHQRGQLAEVEKELKERLADSPVADFRDAWVARARALEQKLFELRAAQVDLLVEQTAAEHELADDRRELGEVDATLTELAARLEGLEPAVKQVVVEVNGENVATASALVAFATLFDLDRQIEEVSNEIAKLEPQKKAVVADYVAAGKDVVKAGNHLATVMNRVAWGRFSTDLGFGAVDVVTAFGKGGLVGAGAELARKWVEIRINEAVAPRGIEPGSVEDQINKEYNAELRKAYGAVPVAYTASSRALKETAVKYASSVVNRSLGKQVFRKLEVPIRLVLEKPDYILKYGRVAGTAKQIALLKSQLKTLKTGVVRGFKFESLMQSIVKDVAKTAIKAFLDRYETQAWIEYAAADTVFRGWAPLYRVATTKFEEEQEGRDVLLERKLKLLDGLDPGGLKLHASKQFPGDASLKITLELEGPQDPKDPLIVEIGGVKATRVGHSNVYTVRGGAIKAKSGGAIDLVIR